MDIGEKISFHEKVSFFAFKACKNCRNDKNIFILQISLVDFKSHAPVSLSGRFLDLGVLAFSVSVSSLFFIFYSSNQLGGF
jgi:hypothetical protein